MKNSDLVGKVEVHPKGWGSELWITNSELYCAKVLSFQAGKKFSWHFHKIKNETFYVIQGSLILRFGWSDEISLATEVKLEVGDVFHVPIEMRHQLEAISQARVLEVSSQHFEEDSYRLIKGD